MHANKTNITRPFLCSRSIHNRYIHIYLFIYLFVFNSNYLYTLIVRPTARRRWRDLFRNIQSCRSSSLLMHININQKADTLLASLGEEEEERRMKLH